MQTQKKVPTMIILWVFVIIVSVVVLPLWYPTLLCGYITKIGSTSNNLPLHTREYQAFCKIADNDIEWAISILKSLKETKLNTEERWRLEYNIALLSQYTIKTIDAKNSDGTTGTNDARILWKKEQDVSRSPKNPEHNTITIESKVQYQGLDQDWIKKEQEKLIQQQLDRDAYINTTD